ncbi:MAG: SprT-like domain-containing protein [Nitrospirota bacterium]
MDLHFLHNTASLRDFFERETGRTLSVVITDNSTSMLSVKKRGGTANIRLHRIFLNAHQEILREIAAFISDRKKSTLLIRKFIHAQKHLLRPKPLRVKRLHIHGRHFNLQEIFDALNDEYFGGHITASITWGNRNSFRSVRKRTLGSYCYASNIIRINPCLDRKRVPGYFISFVVYHEMLHSTIHEEKKNGRRSVHPPDFKKRERLFAHYEKAVSWEKRYF